jgi:transcriptional regulator with XRE-family HTH domain
MRIERGLTLRDLAEALGVSPQAIRRAEIEGEGLDRQKWYRLADLFNCDPRLLETPETPAISP